MSTCTHFARTFRDRLPHALPHAHRTCESAILRTCAPQPNICLTVIHVSFRLHAESGSEIGFAHIQFNDGVSELQLENCFPTLNKTYWYEGHAKLLRFEFGNKKNRAGMKL